MRLILWRYKSCNPIPAIGPREIRPYSPKFGDGPHTRPYRRYAQAKSGTVAAQQILIANATAIVKDPNCSGYLFHRQLVRTVGVRHAARRHSRLHLQPANLQGRHPADRQIVGGWEINGIVQFQTGTPCGVGANTDYAKVSEVGSFGCGNQGQFW